MNNDNPSDDLKDVLNPVDREGHIRLTSEEFEALLSAFYNCGYKRAVSDPNLIRSEVEEWFQKTLVLYGLKAVEN